MRRLSVIIPGDPEREQWITAQERGLANILLDGRIRLEMGRTS